MTREGVGRTDHVVGLEGEVMASRAERMDGSDRSMDMAPTTETLPTGTESDPGGFCQVSMTESEQLKEKGEAMHAVRHGKIRVLWGGG